MPEDRFRDLGPPPRAGSGGGEEAARPPVADRLADLDRGEAEERPRPAAPEPARPAGRYAWVFGVAAVIAIVVAGVNSLPNPGRGLRGPEVGRPLPAFAAPSATGALEGVANVKQAGDEPGPGSRTSACAVSGPGIVNICELRDRPVVLTFIVTRAANCEPALDALERVRREFPAVHFVGVVSGEPRRDVERLVRSRGWGFPVAVDPDGAVINLYRVGVCPTTTFADRGGKVRETRLGEMTDAELRAAVRRLRGARQVAAE